MIVESRNNSPSPVLMQLWHLLNSDRCSAHLFTQRRGGLLLLGAQEASSEGLSVLEADRSDAVAAHGKLSERVPSYTS